METTAASQVGWFDAARRFQQVSFVLARHGFGEVVARSGVQQLAFRSSVRSQPARFAKRLAGTLESLGATYLKLGQLLATRADLFAPEIIQALSGLHASVRPMPFAHVAKVVEAGLGQPINEAFASFERDCLAAASIAQVHRATLHDGSEVVVKVQRPGLPRLVQADLAIMHRLAELLSQQVPETASYDPVGLVGAFARSIQKELDFRGEAQNAQRLRRQLCDLPELLIPRVHDAMTSKHVLVMDFAPGVRLDELPPGERARVRKLLLRAFVRQTIDHGVFHADPHPGNLLVHPDGRVVLLDFGAIDVLEAPLRSKLSRFTLALAMGRRRAMCDAMISLAGGAPSARIDRARMQLDVHQLLDATSSGQGTRIIELVFAMARAHGLRLPPSLLALMRTIAILDGVLRSLDPVRDIVKDLRREFLWASARRLIAAATQPWRWTRARVGEALGAAVIRLRSRRARTLNASNGPVTSASPQLDAE
jgi:ubiquinone biosynthesis protein